jgi:starch synthase (maltosyl-transferring)
MYAGYELYEAVARPGAEEAIDNEKFEIKFRDFEGAAERDKSLAPRIALLNQIRRQNPAIRQLRNLILHDSEDPEILVYSKSLAAEFNHGTPNTVIVVVNTDPRSARETMVLIDLEKLNLPEAFMVEDMITGKRFEWGARNYVKLDSFDEPAHILRVIP